MQNKPYLISVNKNSVDFVDEDLCTTFLADENDRSVVSAQPFIKWAGGKRWLAAMARLLTPRNWSGTYFEPFVGGGSLFFALSPEKSVISDLNNELISTYETVRNNPKGLITILKEYPYEEEFYYSLRDSQPKNKAEIAARFIYLNRAGWNGLYRVNLKGRFNTPFGKYINPTICDENRIKAASRSLTKTTIKKGYFSEAIEDAKKNDLVYLDPPYITGHQNNGFLKYNKNLFSWDDQIKLAEQAIRLAAQGTNVLISNADYPKVVNLYKGFYYYKAVRMSLIGGGSAKRGRVEESILSSYPLCGVESVIIS